MAYRTPWYRLDLRIQRRMAKWDDRFAARRRSGPLLTVSPKMMAAFSGIGSNLFNPKTNVHTQYEEARKKIFPKSDW